MDHIQLYNLLGKSIRENNLEVCLSTAETFLSKLESSGCMYGWRQFIMTGDNKLDLLIHKINRHLTG